MEKGNPEKDESSNQDTSDNGCPPGKKEIFTPYIVKDGKKIYPKNASVFHFYVDA